MLARSALPILLVVSSVLAAPVARATTVLTGYDVVFDRPPGVLPNDPATWDVLTTSVAISRGLIRGIYNAAQESEYTRTTSPVDTEWATALTSPGRTISAANYLSLSFTSWEEAYGGALNLATAIVAAPAVIRLISDDIYLDVRFTLWGQGSSALGAFSYERSAIPEPTTGLLLALGLVGFAAGRRGTHRRH